MEHSSCSNLAGARLRPLGVAGGSEAAPSGLGLAWRWLAATLRAGGAIAVALVDGSMLL